jgi:basic amino acid/polyamine antiporter, APA family
VNVAYYLVLPRPVMAAPGQATVATEFCFRLMGPAGIMAASAAVMCSVLGSLNGNILVAPRLLFAMGHDRLAPPALTRIHPTHATPAVATWVYAAWSALLVLGVGALTVYRLPTFEIGGRVLDVNLPAGKSPFDAMTDFAMFGAVAFETLAVTAIFVFRRRLPDAPRPYRCPLYPIVPAVYVLIMAAVFVNMFATAEQRSEALVGVGFIAVGVLVYRIAGRG